MHIQPYLFFDGHAEAALAFYQEALGAELEMLMRFKESPEPANNPPGSDELVMHMAFRVGQSTIMASDGMCAGTAHFQGFTLALHYATVAEAEQAFANLTVGGTIQMPLEKTFFSEIFGIVQDRFGVSWMVLVE